MVASPAKTSRAPAKTRGSRARAPASGASTSGSSESCGVVVENVRALVSRGLDRVAADLDAAGYRVEARIIAAADVGAPHRRERLFVIGSRMADPDGERVREQQQREPGGHADGLRDRGQGELEHDGAGRGRHPEPGKRVLELLADPRAGDLAQAVGVHGLRPSRSRGTL